ncbi:MAG: hypothetical protein ACM3MK_13955 [Chitinophagales bacterium]
MYELMAGVIVLTVCFSMIKCLEVFIGSIIGIISFKPKETRKRYLKKLGLSVAGIFVVAGIVYYLFYSALNWF